MPVVRKSSQEYETLEDLQREREKIEHDNEMMELRQDIEDMLNQLDSTRNLESNTQNMDAFDDYDTGPQMSIQEDDA